MLFSQVGILFALMTAPDASVILASYGLFKAPEMNYSSSTAITTILIVMATVIVSTIYPALQAARVANARHLPLSQVMTLVRAHTDGRMLGFLGEKAVNVLELNLALDKLGR